VAAHGLRAGIGGIGEVVHCLEESPTGLGDEAREHLALLRAECARLLDLLESILGAGELRPGRSKRRLLISRLSCATRFVSRAPRAREGAAPGRGPAREAWWSRRTASVCGVSTTSSRTHKHSPPSTRILVRLREDRAGDRGLRHR
jgi:hypothetical protein